MSQTLEFTAITASGTAYQIDFPLHPQTRSPEGVSVLMTRMLDCVSQVLEERRDLSDGDVLQALAMTLAIRARMTSSQADTVAALVEALFRDAHQAASEAMPFAAGRA